ncbi:MAG: hypothetical protein HYX78_10665 [Armatimonadetes bacterium]|nr:hypothetical protein [Armatimonadota bacterium]
MRRYTVLLASVFIAVILTAGCGGGGGSSSSPPPTGNSFVLTGRVQEVLSGSSVVGAKVNVDTYETTTNSAGSFSLSMPSRPMVGTYSVDGISADPQCLRSWARVDNVTYDAMAIDMPIAPAGGMDLGIIYLQDANGPPPPP